MKKDTHPKYQPVLFVDSSTGHSFVIGTTLQPKEKAVFEGKEYPVCHIAVSSSSHPFFTGSDRNVDAEGRIEKFKNRYIAKSQEFKNNEEREKEKELADAEAKKKAPKKGAK